jgi:hypothetical protein
MVVTRSAAEEVAEFVMLSAEPVRRVMLLKAAHTSDPSLDPAMILFKSIIHINAHPVANVATERRANRSRVGVVPIGDSCAAGATRFYGFDDTHPHRIDDRPSNSADNPDILAGSFPTVLHRTSVGPYPGAGRGCCSGTRQAYRHSGAARHGASLVLQCESQRSSILFP